MNIAGNVLECIGRTPLVRLNRMNPAGVRILLKLESRNPGGSAKDRVGLAMIEDAEKRGVLKPGALIIEPTSGNTGIGLALAAAVKGYPIVLTMPETMSVERRKLLAAYGAKLELTPGALGMKGAIDRANAIHEATPGSFIPQQFENPANPDIHYRTTAREIWEDCGGTADAFVAGVGTGGTLSGVGRFLKEQRSGIYIAAVEPDASPLLSGGKAGPHPLQGIGANFVPKTLDRSLIDEVIRVTGDEAYDCARRAPREEGILIGISGGAALFAALKLAVRAEFAGKTIVALMPDSGDRYLSSTLFS